MINCIFSEPLKQDGVPPNLNSQEWEFSKMSCSGDLEASTSSIPLYISKIISPDNSRSFYLNKTLSYGDILILFFIVFFLVFGMIGVIRRFISDKFISKRIS